MFLDVAASLVGLVVAAALLFNTSWGERLLRGLPAEGSPLGLALLFGVTAAAVWIVADLLFGSGLNTAAVIDALLPAAGLATIVYVAVRREQARRASADRG